MSKSHLVCIRDGFYKERYDKHMIFVCGIHGVGKTQYCKILSKKIKMKSIEKDFILSGHLSLLDKNGVIHLIDEKVIHALGIDLMIVLVEKPCIIQKRMQNRDGILWDEKFIEQFQQKEVNYARQLGVKLGLDYKIVTFPNKDNVYFGKSLVLSIKPTYVEKIFSGEKKYEFRKKLCLKNVDKIYLYATSPIKKIVGEAEVLEKAFMDKNNLWKDTQKWAGITVDFYEQYFQKQTCAGAYKLGKTIRYENPLELESLGINFIPQSYVYIDTL